MRRILVLYSLIIFFIIGLNSCDQGKKIGPIGKGVYENKISYSKFIDPPNEFRSFTFYSVNDSLDSEELKRQIHGFKDAGFGGLYFHSREGLLTPYLKEDWWDVLDASVEAALEADVQIRFYDEDRWPSGFAGGAVPLASEEYRAKSLVRLSKDTPLPIGSEVLKEDDYFKYICYTAQLGHPLFNGTSYVDLMNPKTVETFIQSTYAPYIDRYEEQIPYPVAIFSDEPHIHARYFDSKTSHQGALSYSPSVRKLFKELFGYDLIDKVELLFEEKENWREVRWQYYQTVATQFENSFSAQIGEYYGERGGLFTGHYLGEDVLEKVRDRIGNSMLHYRNMQIPGIDMLGMSTDNRLTTSRRLTSVANQYGIPRRVSELFGISGHNMNFEDRKRIANWHAINGINHLIPHLSQYSLTGLRKRDYPSTFSYHQPYWHFNKMIEDYQGRISYASAVGEYQPQVLVISPLESEFIRGEKDKEFTSGMLNVLERLQSAHFDYDIGDEQILADIARVHNSNIEVGAMNYQLILLPDIIGLRKTTLDLLLNFIDVGGKVVHLGNRFPSYVDGQFNEDDLALLQQKVITLDGKNFSEELKKNLLPIVEVEGENSDNVWTHVRKSDDGYLVIFMNQDIFKNNRVRIRSSVFNENLILWNPESAQCFHLSADTDGCVELELGPSSVAWITSGDIASGVVFDGDYHLPASEAVLDSITGKWSGRRLDPNALTLDFASYSTDNGKTYSQPEPVIGIHERLSREKYNGSLNLRYTFEVKNLPKKIGLVVEKPMTKWNVELNGNATTFSSNEFYVDRQFMTSEIKKHVKTGVNTIELSTNFTAPQPESAIAVDKYGTEIESLYIIGEFGVFGKKHEISYDSNRNNSGLTPIRPVHVFDQFFIDYEKRSFLGDLVDEGYPFYAGNFELETIFTLDSIDSKLRYSLNFPDIEVSALTVEINGTILKSLGWMPYHFDVTEYLKSGDNKLKVTMVNSLRNLLGPHHHVWRETNRVGPATFSGKGGFPNGKGESDWYDLRLENKETLAWRDDYYMIPFGLLKPVEIKINK